MCLVTWPLGGNEAGVDLVLIQTNLLFELSHVNHVVLLLTSLHLHMKNMRSVVYQNMYKVNSSLPFTQRPGHQTCNSITCDHALFSFRMVNPFLRKKRSRKRKYKRDAKTGPDRRLATVKWTIDR